MLQGSGDHLLHLYFPVSCVLVVLGLSRKGATARYAMIGAEGFAGLNALFGDERAVGTALAQSPGLCYRLPVRPLREAFQRSEALRRVVLRYTSSLVAQTSQSSLCNAHHTVAQRLCCWLLQSADRAAVSELRATHDLIASVLGVRREAVTLAALELQERGAIRAARGRIALLERRALEAQACECYVALRTDLLLTTRDIRGAHSSGFAAR